MQTTIEQETAIDRTALTELVHWVKTLSQAGVSPDVAAKVAKDYFIATCSADDEECDFEDEE